MKIQSRQKLYIILGLAGLVIMGLIFYIEFKPLFFSHPQPQPANPFQECQLLTDSCSSQTCPYFFMCDIMEIINCQVYDCQSYYGVLIKNKEGETITQKYPKPDLAKVEEQVTKCQGEPILLEQKCRNNKLNLKVKVATKGDCSIEAFIVNLDNKNWTAEFEKLENYYNLTLDTCGVVSGITAVGQGGIRIKSWR
ncbi:hypothetical protein KJ636_00085 [Patescibacteria group bacterium]|nr:hypothetical protein [Patescibacteria group bacterium]MBU4481360.1 hypothetical protein [Patescibacteria group bacterium]